MSSDEKDADTKHNTGRGSAYVIAPSNASDNSVDQADIVLPGIDDHVEIDRIMSIINANGGGLLTFTEGLIRPSKQLEYTSYDNISIEGQGNATIIKPKDQASSTLDGDVLATETEFDLVDASDFTGGENITLYDGAALYEEVTISSISGDTRGIGA